MKEKKLGKDKWMVSLSFHTKDEAENTSINTYFIKGSEINGT